MPASAATTTTAQHQQMAREIQNADFAEEYFASLSAPAKRLIEVRKLIILHCKLFKELLCRVSEANETTLVMLSNAQ